MSPSSSSTAAKAVAKRVGEAVAAAFSRCGGGLTQPASVEWRGRRYELPPPGESGAVTVDFSSVNVAKPLHAGHLRATVLGNFVVQINRAFGHRVVGINYLGDWGRQFAVLLAGVEKFGGGPEVLPGGEDDAAASTAATSEADSLAAVKRLQSVYARATAQLPDADVAAAYARLEGGDPSAAQIWRHARRHSLAELSVCYRRLGVAFDRYEFESEYARQTERLTALLAERGLLETAADGARLLRLPDSELEPVVVQKRDGSSLYFGRDLLAAVDRAERFNCRRAHYVVDAGQRLHFDRLARALAALGRPDLADPAPWELHVQFGRVEGMSSRGRGKATKKKKQQQSAEGGEAAEESETVLLRDILDVGRERMLQVARASENSRRRILDSEGQAASADRLSATVVAMEMMRVRRASSVKFSWDRDNSGVGAQYCHARLCSLFDKAAAAGLRPANAGDPAHLDLAISGGSRGDPLAAADELAEQLLAFPAAALEAFLDYEPCVLVAYTNRLVSRANSALRQLPVISCQSEAGAAARLALFEATRGTLAEAMRTLGLTPMRSV